MTNHIVLFQPEIPAKQILLEVNTYIYILLNL